MNFHKMILGAAFLLTSTLWAKEEVEIPINVGIGPSLFWFPGLTPDRDLHTGVRLEIYAVIDQAMIKKFKNRIPKKFRRMATAQQEIHVAPSLMMLIPDAIIISPGDTSSIYGATWTLLGLGVNLVNSSRFDASVSVNFPTLTYLHVQSPANNPENSNLFGIGATPALLTQIRITDNWLLGLSYYHTFQLPLEMNQFERANGTQKTWNHFGEISAVLHYRFPMMQKM